MMKRKFKCFDLSPLLAGLLALSLGLADVDLDKEISLKDQTLSFSQMERVKSEDPKENEKNALHFSLKLTPEQEKVLLEDQEQKEVYLYEDSKDLVLLEDKEEDQAEVALLVLKKEKDSLQVSLKKQKEDLEDGEDVSKEENDELTVFKALQSQDKDYRFKVSAKAHEIRLELLPTDGILESEVKETDLFLIMEKSSGQILLQTGKEVLEQANEADDSSVKLAEPSVTPIPVKTENKANVNLQAVKTTEPSVAPTTVPAKAPVTTTETTAMPVATNAPSQAPAPTTTATPAPTTTTAPAVEKTYLDYAHEYGVYANKNVYIFPTYEEGIAFAESKEAEQGAEIEKTYKMSDEEYANYKMTNFMDVNGFSGWGCQRYDYYDGKVSKQLFAEVIFY